MAEAAEYPPAHLDRTSLGYIRTDESRKGAVRLTKESVKGRLDKSTAGSEHRSDDGLIDIGKCFLERSFGLLART